MDMMSLFATATVQWWSEYLSGFEPMHRFTVLIIAIACGTGIILGLPAMSMAMLGSSRRHRLEAEMKRDMLDRGMSADEIAKVIQAATPPEYLRKPPRL